MYQLIKLEFIETNFFFLLFYHCSDFLMNLWREKIPLEDSLLEWKSSICIIDFWESSDKESSGKSFLMDSIDISYSSKNLV